MVSIGSLWLPIVLSAVAVFIWSSLSHMVLKLHKSDYRQLDNESEVMATLRQAGVEPGTYTFPGCGEPKDMGSPEMLEKYKQGPVGMMNIMPSEPPAMGRFLGQWFTYSVVVGVFVAYLTGRTIGVGADYLAVFRVAGTATFLVYGLSNAVDSIWKGQPWATSLRHMADGLVHSLTTAGIFGWLWP